MSKLALTDDILMAVEKPARYIGDELNITRKDLKDIDIRIAMCFPDVYEIGMSHLGIQILYEMFNQRSDTYCERVYSPWPDLHKIMKDRDIPLFALETQDAIRSFDFLGITLQYEMCYTNVLQILDLAKIPIWQKDRTDNDPIVMGGGPCTYNPEPIADFFDVIYVGEGEVSYDEFLDIYKDMKGSSSYSREMFLRRVAHIDGIYVPGLYKVEYNEDSTISRFYPREYNNGLDFAFKGASGNEIIIPPKAPDTVKRVVLSDLDEGAYPTKPIIPYIRATQDRVVLEIQRGCIRGCRFCQAGMIYRPNRERSLEVLKKQAYDMVMSSGHEEISLCSLSSSDYSKLPELVDYLIELCTEHHVNISLPSLRIDAFSLDVMSKVQDIRKSSLTFAPEAGSQRLRNVINKGLTREDIINGSNTAFEGGWNKVKLYFMLGLPLEEDSDIIEIPELGNEIAKNYYDIVPKEKRNGKCQISMSTSFFVPKPFTPFQWARMYPKEEYLRRAYLLKDTMNKQLNKKSLSYHYHEADVSVLEGVLARGDRKLSRAIYDVYMNGGIYDAWSEFYDDDRWLKAFSDNGISLDFYVYRERDIDEILPWDFIDVGITKKFLIREWENAKKGIVTPNCREKCNGCGAAVFKGGVCIRN